MNFENRRFQTQGVGEEVHPLLVLFLWGLINNLSPLDVLTGLSDNRAGAKPSPELAQTTNVRTIFSYIYLWQVTTQFYLPYRVTGDIQTTPETAYFRCIFKHPLVQ